MKKTWIEPLKSWVNKQDIPLDGLTANLACKIEEPKLLSA